MTLASRPLVTGSPATGLNRTFNQRSRATAKDLERTAMNHIFPGSIVLAHIHADERRKDLVIEAANARLANEAMPARRNRFGLAIRSANLRHRLGVALVRAGHRLQHADGQPAADQAPLGTLGAAR